MPARAAVVLAAVLAVSGCVGGEEVQRQAEATDDGLQATGQIDGGRVAVSSGEPEVLWGDCDPGAGGDVDLCMVFRTIDGVRINLVIENPSALAVGERLPVRGDECESCDDVRTHAVVDLRIDGVEVRATGGSLAPTQVGQRVAADFDLRLPFGDRLVGGFNVRPGLVPDG